MAATRGGTPKTPAPPTTPARTGGGGDDDGQQVMVPGHAHPGPGGPTRKAFIEAPGFEFSPASLVGSWFHRLENDRMVWQGAVVAEPQPGVYLLQVDRLDVGAQNVQRLVAMASLLNDDDGYDYRFYDTQREAQAAYAEWVSTEGQRA
jgi:hypothetical protein